MDFFSYTNKLKPSKGRILVSEPFLPDPGFERTIILLCEHNADGSFGFVLNKPSPVNIGDVMEELAGFDMPLFVGGPVQQDTLHYLHRCAVVKDAIPVADEVYWGGDFENLKRLMETNRVRPGDIKFFLGYSGWSEGQLNNEIATNTWIVSDRVNGPLVFESDPGQMWRDSLKRMGGRYSVYSNYPVDPRMN